MVRCSFVAKAVLEKSNEEAVAEAEAEEKAEAAAEAKKKAEAKAEAKEKAEAAAEAKEKAEAEAKAKAEEAGSLATGGNSGPTHVRAKHFEAKVLFLLVDQCVRLRRRRRKPRKRNRRSSPHGLWTRKCLQKAGHHGS